MSELIYLDHNATSPPLPEVIDAVAEASRQFAGNPGSQHAVGRAAHRALEDARERIGQLLGAQTAGPDPDRVILTSGGTEANNLAVFGLLGSGSPRGGQFVTSAIEHPSILEPARQLERRAWQVRRLGVDRDGVVQIDQLEQALASETRLVSLMLANNETGTLQPVQAAAQLCAARAVTMHTDAVQVIGKMPVDFRALNVAMMTCAAHKLNGPIGIGALVVRHDIVLEPLMSGGHQQQGMRPGTETVALALGMCTALECWKQEQEQRQLRLRTLRDRLQEVILAANPDAVVLGRGAQRLPNTLNISLIGFDRQALLMALDLAGIACSTGSACASGSSEPSPTLLAMGLEQDVVAGSLRMSLGASTTAAEIEEAARRILAVCQRLRQGRNS